MTEARHYLDPLKQRMYCGADPGKIASTAATCAACIRERHLCEVAPELKATLLDVADYAEHARRGDLDLRQAIAKIGKAAEGALDKTIPPTIAEVERDTLKREVERLRGELAKQHAFAAERDREDES